MQNEFVFNLVRPAKNLGGDRYSVVLGSSEWTVYFPQEIARPIGHGHDGRPVQLIKMVVEISDD